MMVHEALTTLRVVPRGLWERFAPYAGLVLGSVALGLQQPLSAFSVFTRCDHAAGKPVTVISIACACIALLGFIISWRGRKFQRDEGQAILERRHFMAIVSISFSALILFALIAGMLASVIVRCE